MAALTGCTQKKMARVLAWAILVWMILAGSATNALAEAPLNVPAADEPGLIVQIVSNLFNSRALLAILSKPEFTLAAFVVLNVIVFVETGIFFFLPGDSLLVTAGVACSMA